MYPSKFSPTPTHYFIKLLETKNMLLRCYTQNIDTLERVANISPDLLVEAHGSFGNASCINCQKAYDASYFENFLFHQDENNLNTYCYCDVPECGGYVKPNIVFFGEGLPSRYQDLKVEDLESCDLLIVIGKTIQR
jgi:NAD-dependent deacetylase sirtuin 2